VLIALFSEHGNVISCNIVKNPQTKQSRGFAFVEMDSRESAEKALRSLDNSELVGQKISVVLAKPPPKANVKRGGRGMPLQRGGFQFPVGPMGPYQQPFQQPYQQPYQQPQRMFSPNARGARGTSNYQIGGRGGKQRGRGGYQQTQQGYQNYTQQPAQSGYQNPRYQPYQNRQPYQQQQQQQQSQQQQSMAYTQPGYQMAMFPQMYGQNQQYYQYPTAEQSQYYQQYYSGYTQ